MHEKAPMLTAKERSKIGTRYNNRLRAKGELPAVVYGRGRDPLSITLDMRQASGFIIKGEKVFRLDFPGSSHADEAQFVLLKDLQFDYLGSNIVHADFARVSLTDRIKAKVAIHLIGEAKGLKQAGAILMHPNNEIEIECVLTELPDSIEVRIDDLDVDHAITAADVKLPVANMKLVTDPHAIIAQIIVQQEIVVAEATAATAEGAQPEVITAKKPEEGAAAGAAAGGDKKAAPAAGGDKGAAKK
ncbi:MAG: 50S ribosomal protein L25 [Planctomycetota bacterium]|nr:50S ribosomal protein L25 [Planctomycetota bacterium]